MGAFLLNSEYCLQEGLNVYIIQSHKHKMSLKLSGWLTWIFAEELVRKEGGKV